MKNLNRTGNLKGVSLTVAVAIMLIVAVLSAALVSLLGTTSRTSVDYLRSTEAFALAQGGMNWYMETLSNTVNWTAVTNQTNIPLDTGSFDINVTVTNNDKPYVDSITATAANITVTGKVNGTDGVVIKRVMSERALKLPSAARFALFWGRRTGSTLTLSGTTVNGDFWSQGTSSIPGGSAVNNGIAYRPVTESITGAGTFSTTNITFPYFSNISYFTSTFSTPDINATYYTNLINTYNNTISACGSGTTVNQNANLVLTGSNDICCQVFSTNTNASGASVTISGHGNITANQAINLNAGGTNGRTLTISPSGGNIVFLAGRSLTVNTGTAGTHPVTGSGTSLARIIMYARSSSSTAQLLDIANANTFIDKGLFLAQRRIRVSNGADITNSTLFVNDAGTTTNNALQVTTAGTVVGTMAGGPCTLISLGRENAGGSSPTALTIDNSASFVGLAYQDDTTNTGLTRINAANITGSLIANQFQGNAISTSAITYNATVIPDPPAEGFDGFVVKEPDSWSGN